MVNPDTVDHRRFLGKGSQVEVCSDEEGFKGAWFEATVVEVPSKSTSKKRKRALVQYNNLLADDGCTLLTELVDSDSIRPPPPQDGGSERGFEVSDVVDAKYKDGWWTGVVTKLLDNSRARVYFDNPPDIIDFDMKDIRLHWKWVDGKWVPAEKNKQLAGSGPSSGTAVEVNLDKDNLRDVWLPAIVIKEIDKDRFLVKCHTSRTCNSSYMEKFVVHMQHIRPTPPPHNVDRDYELLEKVDAFCNCGWRAGVVTKLLSGRRYNIFFKQGNETKELSCTDLRPHDEWIDGNWITKSKEILNDSGNEQKHLDKVSEAMQDLGLVADLENSDVAEGKNAKKMQSLNATNDLMEQSTDTHDTPLVPSIRVMELTTPDTGHPPSLKKLRKSDKPKLEEALNEEFLSTQTMGTTESEVSPKSIKSIRLSARTGKPLSTVIAKTKRCKVGHIGSQIIDVVKTSARASKSTSKSSLDLGLGTGRVANGNKAEQFNDNKLSAKGVEMPIILGLKAKVTRISKTETSPEVLSKESLKLIRETVTTEDGLAGSKSMETPQGHGAQAQRRKRGRPRKFVATSPQESNAGSEKTGEKLTVKEMVDMVRSGAEKLEEMADMFREAQESVVQTHLKNDLTDSQDATAGRTDVIEGNCNMEQAIVAISSNTNDDDQPLSTLFGAISAPIIEGSKLGSTVIANGVNDAQRQVDTKVEDRAKGATSVDDSQILPFKKLSSFWKMLESLDVFQEVPQNPHFRPLAEIKEEFREGTAIGIMVSYSSLFEKVSSLQLDVPKGMLESTLDSLGDLEKHGFDVGLLRTRLNDLSSIRGRQDQLLEESKNAERKLAENMDEKAKCCKEMDEINKKMAELQKQLLAVKSRDEKIDSENASVRRRIDGVQERLANVRNEFKSKATAPWKVP